MLDNFLTKRKISYLQEHKYTFEGFSDYDDILTIKKYRDCDLLFTCKIFVFETFFRIIIVYLLVILKSSD